jgi:hypothetical protein
MTLPAAEEQLKTHLGNQYNAQDWQPTLDAVMSAEGNVIQAQEALAQLSSITQLPRLMIRLPPLAQVQSHPTSISDSQIIEAEKDLMNTVEELVKRKQIIGPPPTLEDLVDPIEERETGDSPYRFEGGDAEIVAEVQREMAIARGEIIELNDSDNDSDEDNDDKYHLPCREVINLCALLEKVCINYGDLDSSLELPRHLRSYRAQLQRDDLLNCTQSSLDSYFTVN